MGEMSPVKNKEENVSTSIKKVAETRAAAGRARAVMDNLERELVQAVMLRDQMAQHPYCRHHESEWNDVADEKEAAYRKDKVKLERLIAEACAAYEEAWKEWEDRIELHYDYNYTDGKKYT